MRRKRLITTTLTILLIIIGIASLVLYKLGDTIFEEVIDSQINALEAAMEQTPIENQIPANPDAAYANGSTQAPNIEQTQNTASNNTQETSTTTNPTSAQKPNVNNQIPTSTQPQEAKAPNMQITIDKLENVKDSVTPADKMSAAAMVLKKLSQADIDTLTKMVAGGITQEEKEKIKAIVYARFTQEEIRQIKAMYVKYMNN